MARFVKWTITLGIVLALWMLAHMIYSIIDGRSDDGRSADVAVILGNKVNPDGSLSKRLTKRLECGLSLYRKGRVNKIIVSGGLGKEGHYEGDKMQEYLLNKGVPSHDVIVDNQGTNTRATVVNTLRIIDSIKVDRVIVVSQYFHITRTKMLFRKQGLPSVTGVSPEYYEFRDLYALVREFFAFYTQ